MPQGNLFYGLWGSARDDVWAVGDGGLLHFDGTRWSAVASAAKYGLSYIWGSGKSDVWAVGGGKFLHYNGVSWQYFFETEMLPPYPIGVCGGGPGDVWVGSLIRGQVWHGTGTKFQPLDLGTMTRFYAGWADSPTDLWMVGESGTIFRYDGFGFTSVFSGTSVKLNTIWGSSNIDAWIAGDGGFLLHWDGRAFHTVSTGVSTNLGKIWGRGPNDIWITGSGILLHYDGKTVTPVTGGPPGVSSLWGSASGDVWATSSGEVLHYDGASWTPPSVQLVPSSCGSGEAARAISGPSGGAVRCCTATAAAGRP